MLYYASIFTILPILLFIWIIGLLTMVLPPLKRYHSATRRLFFSIMVGFGAGLVLSVLLAIGLAFIGKLLSNIPAIPQAFKTVIGFSVLVAPLLLPWLGVVLGPIYSFKQKGRIAES